MTRLQTLNPETVNGKTADLFAAVKSQLGVIPNMMRTMGNSTALLEGYLNLSASLSKGTLGGKLGEQIALAVADENNCDYCASAHSYIAEKMLGMKPQIITASLTGESIDPKTDAALRFARVLVEKKGLVNDADVQSVRDAGYSEGEVGEIVGHVALNVLTNYFNNTANTEIDFPKVSVMS